MRLLNSLYIKCEVVFSVIALYDYYIYTYNIGVSTEYNNIIGLEYAL